ncbi:hypothetical protein [Paenibacillus eucommiae]|uniref:Uncharacterized protein n=1 Tax=Paenibacillus eucommiae TaxID=1355755 RepID=A0ABS4J7Z2_9BACL|nr:hypothetical protein [Paenibacillus eucommiae]MBP1995960.1 hypothetical protein [Paenibacillus eucommiae]
MTKNGRLLINWATDIIEAKNGVVCFAFERGEVMELCIMKAEFEVTYLYFSIESFPIDRFITIEIVADLA